MEWAILALGICFVIFAWMIIQGTRGALAYRRQAAAGDVSVIQEIVEGAINAWRSSRRPKPVDPGVWRGVQSMELIDVGADFVRVSVQAESNYQRVSGQWLEVTSVLQDGMAITAKSTEMLLYELPNVKLNKAQVDVFTSFRDHNGQASRHCILSTVALRDVAANQVDWDEWTPREIVEVLGGRYRSGKSGSVLPIDPYEVTVSQSIESREDPPADSSFKKVPGV